MRVWVFEVPDAQLPVSYGIEGLEVLVTLYDEREAPELAVRPTSNGQPVRTWGPPLRLVRAEGQR